MQKMMEDIEEIKNFVRFMAISGDKSLLEVLEDEFGDEEGWKIDAYSELDGETSTRAIAKKLPVSRPTLLSTLGDWREKGLVTKRKQGKYDKFVSEDLID